MKLSLGEGGAQGFLARHCEKMIAVVVAIVSVWFIYAGFGEEGVDKSKDPMVLYKNAESALTHVNTTDATEPLMKEFTMAKEDYVENVKKGNEAINSGNYALTVPLKTPAEPPHTKRPDPKLYPPKEPLAYVVTGALELARVPDPLLAYENAEAPKIEIAKAAPKKKKKKETNDPSEMMMMMTMDDSMEEPEDGPMSSDMMSSGMGNEGGSKSNWTLPSIYHETYQSKGAGASEAMGMDAGRGNKPGSAGFRAVTFVMVSALAPFQEQWEEFETSFMNATGYVAERDRPNYFYIQVERAEVTDPALPVDQLKWTLLKNDLLDRFQDVWAGRVAEATHADHIDELLAYPMPPMPLRDMTEMLIRSELPIKKKKAAQTTTQADAPTLDLNPDATGEETEEGVIKRRKRSSNAVSSMGMMTMQPDDGDGEEGSSSMGMDMSMGMGMAAAAVKVVDYKLIRFFDFAATPGKRYRYRVRLLLEDPNFPEDEKLTPSIRTLDDEALKRVRTLMSANPVTGGKRKKGWYRATEWSEPTEVVYIAPRQHMLGGTVVAAEQKRIKKTADHEITFDWTEPTGKFLPVVWSKQLASDVPGETEVARGSVLNFKQDVVVPHPLTNVLKAIKEHQFTTNAFVVDIRGGTPLPSTPDDKDPLMSPGEFAVIGANGELIVRNELDDVEDYRRFTYKEDSANAASAGPADDNEMGFGMGFDN